MNDPLPTITLHGTRKADLIEELCEAREQIQTAMTVLALAHPNGRDYPDPDDLGAAIMAHRDRLLRLKAVADELYDRAIKIDEANP